MKARSLFLVSSACILAAACWTTFALSQVPTDRDALLSGAESGQVRPAESNGFAGPERLLELEKDLHLTDAQKKSLRSLAADVHARAVELGKRIAGIEVELNDAFRTGLVSEESVRDDADQIGRLRGKLRGVHLAARLKARRILTPEQISAFRNLKSPPEGAKH